MQANLSDAVHSLTNLQGYLFDIVLALFAVALVGFLTANRMRIRHKNRLAGNMVLIDRLEPSAGLENNLTVILELLSTIVTAPGYAFYIFDPKNRHYTLKAVRNAIEEPGRVEPSYSGLMARKKEVYLPRLSVPEEELPETLSFGRDGDVPVLTLRAGQNGLIRLAPLEKIRRKDKRELLYIADVLPRIVNLLVEADRMKLKTEVVVTSGQALHDVSTMAIDTEAVLRKMISMLTVATGVRASLVAIARQGRWEVVAKDGWSVEAGEELDGDAQWLESLYRAVTPKQDAFWLHGEGPLYDCLPSALAKWKEDEFVLSPLDLSGREGLLLCKIDRRTMQWDEAEFLAAIRSASRDMAKLITLQHRMKPFAAAHVELMQTIASAIDNLNPYTVGYSELMARYSVAVAQQLGLSRQEIAGISIAAYLSNIGVIGLSEELYLKEGKYSETEFEKMKLHAEVGASIVEMTIGDKVVADHIRYHHERMDGNGYPDGLRGDEIPVGARIIAVVQTFLAKVGGRKYREPLPFDQALDLVRAAAGTQLDPRIVEAFDDWLRNKRDNPEIAGKPLGPCWEMCCAPPDICRTCPAYGQTDKPCWEMERNNCQAHGKSCQTCLVYTETLGRKAVRR